MEIYLLFETLIYNWQIILLFFFVAILYSSVGFGGGSSYLAILALTPLVFIEIRSIALLCNIVVVFSGTLLYIKNGLYNWWRVIPLVVLSVPMAFLGGYIEISQNLFFILLGFTLITIAVFMWVSKHIIKSSKEKSIRISIKKNVFFGGIIGFISGIVGIGGGIFLAPLLYFTSWNTPKRIAATSSFFILVNSIAGLIGQYQHPNFTIEPNITVLLLFTVFVGGQIGTRLSINIISSYTLKRITAILIMIVGLKVLANSLVKLLIS